MRPTVITATMVRKIWDDRSSSIAYDGKIFFTTDRYEFNAAGYKSSCNKPIVMALTDIWLDDLGRDADWDHPTDADFELTARFCSGKSSMQYLNGALANQLEKLEKLEDDGPPVTLASVRDEADISAYVLRLIGKEMYWKYMSLTYGQMAFFSELAPFEKELLALDDEWKYSSD